LSIQQLAVSAESNLRLKYLKEGMKVKSGCVPTIDYSVITVGDAFVTLIPSLAHMMVLLCVKAIPNHVQPAKVYFVQTTSEKQLAQMSGGVSITLHPV